MIVFKFCFGNFGTGIMNVPSYFLFLLMLGGAPFYFGVSKTSLSEKRNMLCENANVIYSLERFLLSLSIYILIWIDSIKFIPTIFNIEYFDHGEDCNRTLLVEDC